MTPPLRLSLAVALTLFAASCGSGSKGSTSKSTSPAATSTPASVNVLTGSSASGTASGPGASAPATSTTAPATSASGLPTSSAAPATSASGATVPAAPSGVAPIAPSLPATASAPAAPLQAQLYGTVPPDPATGFDGALYLVGERLVPGSIVHVSVNGIPTKVLPATFYSSELIAIQVYLTVPADYTFTAVAPDGTLSQPVDLTVPNGGVPALAGLLPPEVHMAFPPSLETQFSGTVWLIGEEFVRGCVLTVSSPGLPPYVAPLVHLNERTVGWVTTTPLAGPLTLEVTNPTLLSSQPITLNVQGPGAPAPAGGVAPVVNAPSGVASPFVGSVHLTCANLELGASAELRDVATHTSVWVSLIRVSSAEAWLTLAYPAPGAYELRVLNPGGAGSPWAPFDVR